MGFHRAFKGVSWEEKGPEALRGASRELQRGIEDERCITWSLRGVLKLFQEVPKDFQRVLEALQ